MQNAECKISILQLCSAFLFEVRSMSEIKHSKIEEIPVSHKCDHEGYEYFRRKFIPFGGAQNTLVSVYEIPPGKAAYPYHFHHKNEETFYIPSGEGVLKTPDGERKVKAGEMLFFPTGPEGAHKLTNSSETEMLTYMYYKRTSYRKISSSIRSMRM